MPTPQVIVIGAGVGGLSAAIRLAARGARVTLLEKQPQVGGKLNRWIAPHPDRPHDRPFTFDTGPSLLTLPFVFQDLFAAAGTDVREYLSIEKLDPVSRFVWADGRTLALRSDENAMREAIARFSPADIKGWNRFLDRGHHIWELAGEFFLMHAPEQIFKRSDARALDSLRMATIPFRIGMFAKFSRAVDRHIRDPRLREVLYQYATYSGASPFLAPATLTVIPYCELHFGGWYIKGGMYALATALESRARKLNVEIRVGTEASRIVTSHQRATAVELTAGEDLSCDAVICNADVVWAYQHLLAASERPTMSDKKLATIEPGGSGMVLLLGVQGTYPQLAHHTKFMPADYRSDLRAMFETRTIPDDPCIYVCASTRSDPTQAPEGCENLFVLCSAPALDGTLDWSVEGPRYQNQIIDTLEYRFGLTDLAKRIVVQKRITPADLAGDYHAHRGSIYGISSNGLRAAFLRPPNRDKTITNLFFAGGATHPGGGLPLVALSGKIASELCADELGLARPRMNADKH
jgi:phytoene desaturase